MALTVAALLLAGMTARCQPTDKADDVKAAAEQPQTNSAPAKQQPPYMDYADSAEAVDHAIDVTFVPRNWDDERLAFVRAAWKEIVADVYRPPVKVIFDTDLGTDVDDAMALAFALNRPELQVLGVTTSRKEVYQRAAIVARLLQVTGRIDVPYAPGSPILADGTVSRETKPVNEFPFAGPEYNRIPPAFKDAQELFRSVITANPGEVWVVVTGAFTNVAILIRDHPEVAAQLKGIACLGGDFKRTSGGTNIGNDKKAAEIVLGSDLVKFAVSGVTYSLLITKKDVERLRLAGTPTSRAIHELITQYWKPFNAPHKPGPVAFDVAPFVWLFAPDLFTTEERSLSVESLTEDTVKETAPCVVTTSLNAVGIHRLLMDTLTAK
jgi:purine nucleosidase/pyrimidine-specific ribonucleoside hydrolase